MAKETFTVNGNQLVDKVKELIHQGNIRRVRLLHKGRPLIDVPLTVGVPLAALGAIAALVTECTIEVERVEDTPEETNTVQKKTKD
jgi:hypothetical protein